MPDYPARFRPGGRPASLPIMSVPGRTALLAALSLACAALAGCVGFSSDIPYSTLDTRYGGPPSQWWDTSDGLRVRFRDEGPREAPVLLMIHGFSASLEAWAPWTSRLSGDYRIISLDLPGHGLTRAPASWKPSIDAYADLADSLAAHLGVTRYVVIGNSMGGAAAWDDALRHKDHVRALVLVDSAGWPGAHGEGSPLFAVMRGPVGRAVFDHIDTRSMATSGLRQAYVDPALVTPALIDRYVDFSRAPGHRDTLLRIRSRPAAAITAASLVAITVPTLVMHGEADRLIPLSDGKAFAGAIPGAKLITYPGVGHVPMEQAPDASAADLRLFLEALP